MPAPSRNTHNAAQWYDKVIWNAGRPLLDFDFNESQDIARDWRNRLLTQLADGTPLFGSAGWMSPGSSARAVHVAAGVAAHGGEYVRIPAVTNLAVFGGGTTTGVHTTAVYVDVSEALITPAEDSNIQDPVFIESTHRTKSVVQVLANIGSPTPPAAAPGHRIFSLGTVTHDFALGTSVLSGDIAMATSGVTPGELAGTGPSRTLRLKANAPATAPAHQVDTVAPRVSGVLWQLLNGGAPVVSVDAAGNVGIGTVSPSDALHVVGGARVTGTLLVGAGGDPVWHAGNDGATSGLDADLIDGQHLADLDARYLRTIGGALTGAVSTVAAWAATLPLSTSLMHTARVTGDLADRFAVRADGRLRWGAGLGVADAELYRSSAGVLKTDTSLTVSGRTRMDGNFLSAAPTSAAVLATQSVPVASVGARALVVYLKVDPGSYTGAYDVNIYGDNNTVGTVQGKWLGQVGVIEDRAPFFFANTRTDEVLYVQITKAAQTGISHTFAVTVSAERFA